MAGEEGESGIFQKEKVADKEKVSDCFSSGGRRLQTVFPLEGEGFRLSFLWPSVEKNWPNFWQACLHKFLLEQTAVLFVLNLTEIFQILPDLIKSLWIGKLISFPFIFIKRLIESLLSSHVQSKSTGCLFSFLVMFRWRITQFVRMIYSVYYTVVMFRWDSQSLI